MNAATAAPYYAPSRAEAAAEIIRRAEWLQREADSYERRLENATQAGADLAATVSLFLADPQALGTDALYEANQHFLLLHAGNFTHDKPGPSSSGPMCSL